MNNKKLAIPAIMLLAAPAFAVSLVVETGQNVNPGSGVSYYESINFAGSGSISQTAMIHLDGVYGEHAGNIWVGDGVSGTITSAADNGIYLQSQTGASAGYIQGASRDTSTLTFAGNAISTGNNAEQDLYVKDITLNMRKDLSSNNFIRGAGICFENATVNILYSDVGDTQFISGGISNLTESRNYVFNSSTLNVEGGLLFKVTNQASNRSVRFNSSEVVISETGNLKFSGNVSAVFDKTTVTIKGTMAQLRASNIMNSTFNVYSSLDLTTTSAETCTLSSGVNTFNLYNGGTLVCSKNMTVGSRVTFKVAGDGTATIENLTANSGAILDIGVSTSIATLTAGAPNSIVNIAVAQGGQLTSGAFIPSSDSVMNIALSDDIFDGQFIVTQMADALKMYDPTKESSFYFVDDNGEKRVLGENLWIKDLGSETYSIYTAVPEPAQVASFLALMALGFAAYRRRK